MEVTARQLQQLPDHGPAHGRLAVPHALGAFVALIIFLPLTSIAVGMRFYGRRLVKGHHYLYDWMVVAALIIYYGYVIVSLISLFLGGTGWQINDLGRVEIETALKIDLVLEVTYATSMGLLKCSMCLTLIHIFPSRRFRFKAIAVLVLSICWAIMTILIGFLICTPLSYNWNTTIPGGHCGNQNAAYSAVAAIDILVDVMIIALPLPQVWKLQVPTVTKLALSFLFALGLFTIAITGVRLHALLTVDFSDFSYSSTAIFVWTTVEWGVAIIVTCGPSLRPVLEKIVPKRFFSNSKSRTGRKTPSFDRGFNAFKRINDDGIALEPRSTFITHVESGAPLHHLGEDNNLSFVASPNIENSQGINVETDWKVERS